MTIDVEDFRDHLKSAYAESNTYAPLEQFLAGVDDPRPLLERRVLRLGNNVAGAVKTLLTPTDGQGRPDRLAAMAEEVEALYQKAGAEARFQESLSAWRQAAQPAAQETPSSKNVIRLLKKVVTDAQADGKILEAFTERRQDKTTPFLLDDCLRRTRLSTEKASVVRQAIVLISQFDAHLPFKRARYAIDPLQRLRLIADRFPTMTEREFHAEMIETFKELRDAHTFYSLPRPYRGHVAFLPFLMEDCAGATSESPRRYLVTKILSGFPKSPFEPGAEVTHWNGMPMEKAVLDNADREPGNNPASRLARGLARLTVRPLAFSLPPDEDWITITYLPDRKSDSSDPRRPHRIMLPWGVWRGRSKELFGRTTHSSSVCESVAETHIARKALWCGEKNAADEKVRQFRTGLETKGGTGLHEAAAQAGENGDVDLSSTSIFPEIFQFRVPLPFSNAAGRRFGYVRIRNFDHAGEHSVPDFVEEFRRILTMIARLAPDGLIVDIRGNPGGSVPAAERILQMLTPAPVTPERFHCINTPLMRRIATKGPLDFMDMRFEFGRVLSNGKYLTRPDQANDVGQVYHGPSVLITDALCYSAADIFAAGFQDHAIGPVIGVDTNTGAGGANRWMHHELVNRLRNLSPNPLEPLPEGTAMGVALRRSLRVGRQAGEPLEDVGVMPEIVRPLTATDLLEGNSDLIDFACENLAALPSYQLGIEGIQGRIRAAGTKHLKLRLTVVTRGITRLEAHIHDRPQIAVSVDRGESTTTLDVPLPSEFTPFSVELKGFVFQNSEWVLVASRKRKLTTADRRIRPEAAAAAGA